MKRSLFLFVSMITYRFDILLTGNDVCRTIPRPCHQKCQDVDNNPVCSCYDDFRLDNDNVTCRVVSGKLRLLFLYKKHL